MPQSSKEYPFAWWSTEPSFRNQLAVRLCNFIMRFVADDQYERCIEWLIKYGARSWTRDVIEGRNQPPIYVHHEQFGRFGEPPSVHELKKFGEK